MYRKHYQPEPQIPLDEFYMAFGGRLSKANRWVKLADMIPWDEVEKRYAEQFTSTVGNPAYPVRVAFGALVIKEKLKITDEETVEQIRENPYLQCQSRSAKSSTGSRTKPSRTDDSIGDVSPASP